MLNRLAAAALAALAALCLSASVTAHAQESQRAPAVPDLSTGDELPPAVSQPRASSEGAGVGWGTPSETCFKLSRQDFQEMFDHPRVTREAVIIEQPAPELTDRARRNGTQGVVRLGLALSKGGKVMAVWVFTELPDGLTERAVEAACRVKFRPAESNNRPVTSRAMVDYHFHTDRQYSRTARPAPEAETRPASDLPPAVTSDGGKAYGPVAGPGTRPSHDMGGGMRVGDGGPAIGGGGSRTGRDPSDYETPFRASEAQRKAVITEKPEPSFTEEARRNETWGLVRLRAALSKTGAVTNISVVKGLPDGLTEKAIAAARKIKFKPAQKDGRTVSQWVTLEYNFSVHTDEDSAERKAVILEQPAAEYTEEARRQRVEGTVILEMMLYRGGKAELYRVVQGLPHGLTEQAVEAARKLRFTPAEDEGRPVTVVRRVEYRFAL